jgi:DNA repair protein RecN (Recombination protein N)
MLTELRVENLGIIDEVQLAFSDGMTVITGETGAGKTLLVDALDLLCGGRADPHVVREGATEARVEARFLHEDEEVVLARIIPAEGRSRGYINGHLATASELAELGRALVDLHGQHAHQSLLAPAAQRTFLDRFAGAPALNALAKLRAARDATRALDDELAKLGGDTRARARELDLLRYQLTEIDAAGLNDGGEDERLRAEEEVLADAEAHREALDAAYTTLEGAAADALGSAVAAIAGREPFREFDERLRALQGEVADVARDVRATAEGVVADPDRLAAVHQRRAQLHDLMRKYGSTLEEVLAFAAEARARLEELEQYDARAAHLEDERRAAEAAATRAASSLTKARRAAVEPLGDAVTTQLRALAMPKASVTVALEPSPLTDDGADDVTFLLAPNPGEPPRPLARTASGGELSRTMLALRVVLSEAPPTLVFDEVDAGIGGEAGTAVGRALALLGGQHQVLCVTHLAQVAAAANAQIAVTKQERDGRTVACAEILLDDARINEISRMLAGVEASSHARKHARELLQRSKVPKP